MSDPNTETFKPEQCGWMRHAEAEEVAARAGVAKLVYEKPDGSLVMYPIGSNPKIVIRRDV